jgi:mRNA interferase RelE/StbE
MMQIQYTKVAVKSISTMDKQTQQRIKKGIEDIPIGDILPLQGSENEYRLRIGKYRIMFEYRQNGEEKILYILDVGSRGDIYK